MLLQMIATVINIWSGIALKPRKAKFPDHSFIINEIKKFL